MMKKFLYSILFIFLSFSCSKDQESIKGDNFHLSTDQIKNIAIQHNESMKFIYDDLSNKLTKEKNVKSKFEAINHSMNLYFHKTTTNDKRFSFMQTLAKDYFDKAQSFEYQFSDGRLKHEKSPIFSIVEENRKQLSESQISLLLKCDKALSKDHEGLDNLLEKLNQINAEANLLPNHEKPIVLIALEICKYSALYWSENLDDWYIMLNDINPNYRMKSGDNNNESESSDKFDWGEVAKLDVAGAIGGATYATVVNVVPGWGQAAYGSAILGGAIGGSVGGAAKQLLDKWF